MVCAKANIRDTSQYAFTFTWHSYVCWKNIFLNIQQFYISMKNDRKFNCYPKTSKLIAVACHQGNQ